MAWIESHTGLERHDKLVLFKNRMRWSKNEAIGFLHRFWWTVLEYAPDGVISTLSPEVMSETLGMTLEQIGQALVVMEEVRFLNRQGERLLVTNWLDYAGRYLQENKYRHKPEKWQLVKDVHDMSLTSHGQANAPNQPNQPTKADACASGTGGSQTKKTRKPATGPHAEVCDHYVQLWEARYGAKCRFRPVDGAKCKELLFLCAEDSGVAKRVLDRYLAESGGYYEGHPLTKLTSGNDFPKFYAKASGSPPSARKAPVSREDN